MRPIDADMGREKLQEIYNAWNLAMAPAEGREIAYVDKKMRLCELMIKFLDQLPTIPPPPNDPLTLEELREMDEEPVWLSGNGLNRWDILRKISTDGFAFFLQAALPIECCGKTWIPYRRKPEKEHNCNG